MPDALEHLLRRHRDDLERFKDSHDIVDRAQTVTTRTIWHADTQTQGKNLAAAIGRATLGAMSWDSGCAECARLSAKYESLIATYMEGSDSFWEKASVLPGAEYDRFRAAVKIARLNAELAKQEFEEHRRTHTPWPAKAREMSA